MSAHWLNRPWSRNERGTLYIIAFASLCAVFLAGVLVGELYTYVKLGCAL